MNFAAVVLGAGDHAAILFVVLAFCIAERVNKANALAGGFGKSFFTNDLDHAPKRRRAKLEYGLNTIDADVIVKNPKAGPRRQLAADRKFSRSRRPVDDYQFHKDLIMPKGVTNTIKMRLRF